MTPQRLATLHAKCFETPRPWTAAEFTNQLDSQFTQLFEHTNGFALVRAIADEAELLTLATDPDHRRKGIANNLLAQLHAVLIGQGIKDIFLEVAADNQAAQSLYSTNGYSESGLRRDYYRAPNGDKIDAHLLTKQLT